MGSSWSWCRRNRKGPKRSSNIHPKSPTQRINVLKHQQKDKQRDKQNIIKIGDVKVLNSKSTQLTVSPYISNNYLKSYNPPKRGPDLYRVLARLLKYENAHLFQHRMLIVLLTLLPTIDSALISMLLALMKRPSYEFMKFVHQNKKVIKPKMIRQLIAEIKQKGNAQRHQIARKRYNHHIQLVEGKDISEQQELFNIYYIRKPIQEWSKKDIISTAFAMGLPNGVIYIFIEENVCGQNIQEMKLENIKQNKSIIDGIDDTDCVAAHNLLKALSRGITWSHYRPKVSIWAAAADDDDDNNDDDNDFNMS